MATDWTWHMVTAWNFLYQGGTLAATLNVGRVLPLFYLLFENRIAAFALMWQVLAFWTDFHRAFGATKRLLLMLNWYDHRAFRIRAPHQVRVLLDLCILKKLLIHLIRLLWSKPLYLLVFKLYATMRTVYRVYLHTCYLFMINKLPFSQYTLAYTLSTHNVSSHQFTLSNWKDTSGNIFHKASFPTTLQTATIIITAKTAT